MNAPDFLRRFWVYQAERFPLISYALLVAALVAGGFGYSGAAQDANPAHVWSVTGFAVAWITALGIFFQLRVADEHKDFALDARFRAYRPVPRGLISLRALAWLALGFGMLQLTLNAWLDLWLLLPLALVWGYLWLMRREFFVHDRLVARPLLYMLSHMVILVWLFAYIVAAAVWPGEGRLPDGLGWFLLGGFAAGIVFELGRKIRAPTDEEPGVETYSKLWGPRAAAAAWWLALTVAGLGLGVAGWTAGMGGGIVVLYSLLCAGGLWPVLRYGATPTGSRAKWIDRYSAIWVLVAYSGLAVFSFFS